MAFWKKALENTGTFVAGTVTETGESTVKGAKLGAKFFGGLGALTAGGVAALIALAAPQVGVVWAAGILAGAASGLLSGALAGGASSVLFGPAGGIISFLGTAAAVGFTVASTLITGGIAAPLAIGILASTAAAVGGGVGAWKGGLLVAGLGFIKGLVTGGTKSYNKLQETRGVEVEQKLAEAKYHNMQARRELQETLESGQHPLNQPDVRHELAQQAMNREQEQLALTAGNERSDGQKWGDIVGGPKERQMPGAGQYGISKYSRQQRETMPEVVAGRG